MSKRFQPSVYEYLPRGLPLTLVWTYEYCMDVWTHTLTFSFFVVILVSKLETLYVRCDVNAMRYSYDEDEVREERMRVHHYKKNEMKWKYQIP